MVSYRRAELTFLIAITLAGLTALGLLLLMVGCGTIPTQSSDSTVGNIGKGAESVAADVQQSVTQQAGVQPEVLAIAGAWGCSVLFSVILIAILLPNPENELKWLLLAMIPGMYLGCVLVTWIYV